MIRFTQQNQSLDLRYKLKRRPARRRDWTGPAISPNSGPMRSPFLVLLLLAGCGTTYAVPEPPSSPPPVLQPDPGGSGRSAAAFVRVASRIEPVAEALCREEAPSAPRGYCDFAITLDIDPRMPANAF